jgi:hypothetical protein
MVDLISNIGSKLDTVSRVESLIEYVKKTGKTDKVVTYIAEVNQVGEEELEAGVGKPLDQKEAIKYLTTELEAVNAAHTSALAALDKLCEYLDVIIKSHQEFVTLNQCYKAVNKNQLVAPFKPHVVIIHNSLGNNLNKLHEKLSKYNQKYTTKYKQMLVGKP